MMHGAVNIRYQSSSGPPDPIRGCTISKEPYVFVPFLDKCDIGSDRSELLMEAYFISLAFMLLRVNFFPMRGMGP